MCRKMQFHSCHSKENAVQLASQHVFRIISWHPKEHFVASTASPYPSLHYSLALLHCQWREEEEDRKEELHMHCPISAPLLQDVAKGWLSSCRTFLNASVETLDRLSCRLERQITSFIWRGAMKQIIPLHSVFLVPRLASRETEKKNC